MSKMPVSLGDILTSPTRLLKSLAERESRINSEPYRFSVDRTGTSYTRQELTGVIGQNVTNPRKLWLNLKHPISEWVHTDHNFNGIPGGLWINEHYLFSKLVTVDVLREDESGDYYGKAQQTGRMFSLIQRIYATSPSYPEDLRATLKANGASDIEGAIACVGNRMQPEQARVGLVERIKAVGIAAGYAYLAIGAGSREINHHYSLTPELHPVFRHIRRASVDISVSSMRTAVTGRDYLTQAFERKNTALEKAQKEFEKASKSILAVLRN